MLTRRALLKSAALTAGTLIRVDDSQEAVASRIGVDKVLASVGGPIVEMNTICWHVTLDEPIAKPLGLGRAIEACHRTPRLTIRCSRVRDRTPLPPLVRASPPSSPDWFRERSPHRQARLAAFRRYRLTYGCPGYFHGAACHIVSCAPPRQSVAA